MTGKVVDHNETGVRYAVSEKNFNEKIHSYVRDLKPGESVLSFQPKAKGDLAGETQLDLPEDYSGKDWTVEALNAEIEERNESYTSNDQALIVPASTKKHDLVAALLQDDTEINQGG